MKYLYQIFALIILSLVACHTDKQNMLETGFENPPDSIRVGCYWYWIDKTITKEGVIADLQAMKQAGITRAFIGMTGGGENLEFMSDEWWNLIHATLKTASELDIEIGMFNCPGWSQSGGPWIKSNQAMRYLAAVEKRITGPAHFSEKIPITQKDIPSIEGLDWSNESYQSKPEDFQDVKVLAFPIDGAVLQNLFKTKNAEVIVSKNIQVSVKNSEIRYQLPENKESSITLKLPSEQPAQSLKIFVSGKIKTDVELQALKNEQFITIDTFTLDHSVDGLVRGFIPNSPVVAAFPETVSREFRLVFRNAEEKGFLTGFSLMQMPVVERYPEKTMAKMFNSFAPPWDAYMWSFQTADTTYSVNTKDVIDISDKLASDGTLTWDVPPGEWVVLRTGMLPTGLQNSPSPVGAMGLEVDKMSGQLAEYHFDSYIGKILERIPPEDRRTFRVVVLDSYEKGGQNFTDNFIEIFKQTYGYDPTVWLPSYYGYPVGSPALSNRFLWDIRRMLADRMAHEYIGTIRRKSNENGLVTWLENYGTWGFAGEFLNYGGQSDEVGGEFWLGNYLGEVEIRCAASCAHTYGKQVVWAESFTGSGPHYTVYPAEIKQKGDWAMAQGVNGFMLHVNIQQQADSVFPGVDAWYNVEFNRKNTWFSQLDLFTTYLRRCSYMLRQGRNVADIAYYIGEDAPKMDGITEPKPLEGYRYDFINAEVLMNYAKVKNGKLTLPSGNQYRVLVLPPQSTMRPQILEKIVQLAENGLIVIGTPPEFSPSLQDYPDADKKVKELAVRLSKKIYYKVAMDSVFHKLRLYPDFYSYSITPVLFTHRKTADADIYFLTNQSDKKSDFQAQFRVSGLQPELWNPVSGEIRDLPVYANFRHSTTVPLSLEPSESVFIVFRKKGMNPNQKWAKDFLPSIKENFPDYQTVKEINAPWTVHFQSDPIHRGPSKAVVFDTLQDWSKSAVQGIKYYSGTAVYDNIFKLEGADKYKKLQLEFDGIGVMAKVKINGQYAGGVWAPPYRLDITQFVKENENLLEIEVVNTWGNRIIGDLNLPVSERRLDIHQGPYKDSPLQPSGLMGKVRIIAQSR
ncbi:MAG: glycoside hydrolase family 2 [Dysgonamonadaceae bacterium]|jgi:hypothetical protein|nr:glycoside hydrolase family 2 [Dysgonamonadaceae bacterium]